MPADSANIFLNSEYVVIEYADMLQSPYYRFLSLLKYNKNLYKILKLEDIDYLSETGLLEWYVKRNNVNILYDLNRYPDKISNEELDKLFEDELKANEVFYEHALNLLLLDIPRKVKTLKVCKDVIIYYPYENPYVKKHLDAKTNTDNRFIYNIDELIDLAKNNSTYFFSDYRNILKLKDKGQLKMSSVTLAIDYSYNIDNNGNLRFDFNELYKENPFKLSYVRTCTE